jgi:hypothetical protein
MKSTTSGVVLFVHKHRASVRNSRHVHPFFTKPSGNGADCIAVESPRKKGTGVKDNLASNATVWEVAG